MAKPTKKPGKELVKWDEKLAAFAQQTTDNMKTATAKFLSIRSGQLSYGGQDIEDNELRCVILGWIYENQFYEGRFDPNTPQVPSCYAFGTDYDAMEPHPKAENKQNDTCAGCPNNEYGTSDTGRGKACKNVIRVALIAESDLEDLDSAELIYFKVPVTSVKNFTGYAKKELADKHKRPLWSVVTLLKVEKDADTQVKVRFTVAKPDGFVEDEALYDPLNGLWEKTMEGIDFPYPEAVERAARPAKGKAKPSKFSRR